MLGYKFFNASYFNSHNLLRWRRWISISVFGVENFSHFYSICLSLHFFLSFFFVYIFRMENCILYKSITYFCFTRSFTVLCFLSLSVYVRILFNNMRALFNDWTSRLKPVIMLIYVVWVSTIGAHNSNTYTFYTQILWYNWTMNEWMSFNEQNFQLWFQAYN